MGWTSRSKSGAASEAVAADTPLTSRKVVQSSDFTMASLAGSRGAGLPLHESAVERVRRSLARFLARSAGDAIEPLPVLEAVVAAEVLPPRPGAEPLAHVLGKGSPRLV